MPNPKQPQGIPHSDPPPPPEESEHVDHPAHYNRHPSGIEAIEVCEHMNFNLGNAVKYIWRADEKGSATEDLKKAIWYLDRELKRREHHEESDPTH